MRSVPLDRWGKVAVFSICDWGDAVDMDRYSIDRMQPGRSSLGDKPATANSTGARKSSPRGRASSFRSLRLSSGVALARRFGLALDTVTGLGRCGPDDHRDRREPENLATDATAE